MIIEVKRKSNVLSVKRNLYKLEAIFYYELFSLSLLKKNKELPIISIKNIMLHSHHSFNSSTTTEIKRKKSRLFDKLT